MEVCSSCLILSLARNFVKIDALTSLGHEFNILIRGEMTARILDIELFALMLNFLFFVSRVGFWNVAGIAEGSVECDGDPHLSEELVKDSTDHTVFKEEIGCDTG